MQSSNERCMMLPFTIPSCTVYHGTNLFSANIIQQHGIWLSIQRRLTDFGKRFYVTFNFKQARNWAYTMPFVLPNIYL